jgi:hypothetical protein
MKIPSYILPFLCQHQNIIILEKKALPSLALSSEMIGPLILKQQTCSLKFKFKDLLLNHNLHPPPTFQSSLEFCPPITDRS